jgi:ankyrin repeat protein
VELLLSHGAKIETKDALLRTPLWYAIFHSKDGCIEALNLKNADKEAKDGKGDTLLLQAVNAKKQAAVTLLIGIKANVNCVDKKTRTPLYVAAQKDLEKIARLLVTSGADVERVDITTARTLLHRAVEEEQERAVEILLKEGAKIDATDNKRQTPLHLAASKGFPAIITILGRRLKEMGINSRDINDQTPLHLAAENGDDAKETIVELVKNFKASVTIHDKSGKAPLHLAASNTNDAIEILKFLLDNGAIAEAKDTLGRTAFHLAAAQGNDDIVKELLARHAEKDARDNAQQTPLHLAASTGNVSTVKLLIDDDANKNVQDSSHRTPLHLAAISGADEVIEILMDTQVQDDIRDSEGHIALYYAIIGGHKNAAEHLAKRWEVTDEFLFGLVDDKFSKAKALLASSVADDDTERVMLLLSLLTTKEIPSPLGTVAASGNVEHIRLLLSNAAGWGADPTTADDQGNVPLYYACRNGHQAAAELLATKGWSVRPAFVAKLVNSRIANPTSLLFNELMSPDAEDRSQGLVHKNVRVLLRLGASTGASTSYGTCASRAWTPLHEAAYQSHSEAVEVLVKEGGANRYTADSYGYKPITWASGIDATIKRECLE